jgi:sugar transferase (PEP-CTERM/EpsH1 system associated)
MKNLLFLVHRIPYPPNKGDKIRSFNILKFLAQSHAIHLGAFIDDPKDWRYADDVGRLCVETCFFDLNPQQAKLRSLSGLLTGDALSVPYYADSRMRAWVERSLAEKRIDRIMVYSSTMAQYVETCSGIPRIIDFVDVDSEKWRQYADRRSWPMNWIYRREGERLLAFDRRIARSFDRSFFVSEAEAALFARLAPETAERVGFFDNGVDTEFFRHSADFANPYPAGANILVFTGAMDYWANVDAVTWFAENVFPDLRRTLPTVRFFVVGARPTPAVKALERVEGITVTGGVKDIRPYLQFADCAVAPLQIARGVQNKVLEAMAMGKPVVASPGAMEGIAALEGLDTTVAEAPADWTRALLPRLAQPLDSRRNRAFVETRYGWASHLSRLAAALEAR